MIDKEKIKSDYKTTIQNENIDFSDIPEIIDFSKARKNPFKESFKEGYTIIIEREGYNEVRKYDFSKIPLPKNGGEPIPFEVTIEKRV